jgi:hypothetical protein
LIMKLESDLLTEKRFNRLRNMKISNINLKNIEDIREVIKAEEGKEVTAEETLSRVLIFYKRFVPYN